MSFSGTRYTSLTAASLPGRTSGSFFRNLPIYLPALFQLVAVARCTFQADAVREATFQLNAQEDQTFELEV
jgi:hypothetical protein